ncbi:N-6 DNA methylase [Flavobacterium psychrotolerans]|uniref:Restriction endonuclease subunit S n=1 Tax=Flavobacterium psychrotolerans TaxID=2169410 RepID=A0A2U1JHU5_9FLAO|nr:N-6 DNA methylase [Flavobacterium psychrotolerans]PWA04569.1 restriction endonuclease subunit S [Flavobacterium psychrotolerans]
MPHKKLIQQLGFLPKENTSGIFYKKYVDGYCIEVDFEKNTFHFGGKIKIQGKDSQNITKPEDWVVLECVNRLLEKGYKPENISLEKVYPAGHGFSARLDVCVTREDGSEYLLIECKTYGREFEKEFTRMKKDGGQLFTYFNFSRKADAIMLYASELNGKKIVYKNEIVKIEDDYRTGDVKDFYDKWSKLTKDNGVFDNWVNPYNFESKALTINELVEIKPEDSSFIFNRFLEILRHNVVSDKGNAFNKIFTLFLCKIYDEKDKEGTDNELEFQWKEGENHRDFQLRLTDLYKKGMYDFLEKRVTDFSETEFNNKFNYLKESDRTSLLDEFRKIRLEKNNEFAIKDVYDEQSFNENAIVVKEVVELLQRFKIRYTKKQQYLSDFFELLLTTGLKQESGQFFTPVPVAQFIIKSLPIDVVVEEKLQKGLRDELLPYVMDYAAGSGHFLTETMHEIQRLLDKKIDASKLKVDARKFVETSRINHFDWALNYVYGIEKDYRLVKVGKVGCYLHGDGLANVIHSDGLARFAHPDYKGKLLTIDKIFPKDNKEFDIIVSNPPYSVSSFKNTSSKFYKGEEFELYEKLTDNSSEIECLFIERTKQLLKDGGVAGIILPSSILSNAGIYTKSREIILQYFDIVAITELGSNTFMATGTNTVVLFLRRKSNYKSIHLKNDVTVFFTNMQDVTLNGIEKPVTKYVNHVWEGISFDDYVSLLKKAPNKAIAEHEIYIEYQKKLKAKNDKEFWTMLLEKEADKLFYFIIAFPQKVVLVKSGEKDAEKRFLGYEFSNRRGSEGIHPIQRGKNIEDCTQMFDPEVFDNPTKASTYIYKAFAGDYDFDIDEAMQNKVSRHNLVDMMTFDRVEFEKNISLSVKKKVVINSKYQQDKVENIFTEIKNGKNVAQSDEVGNYRVSRIESIANANFNINATKWTNDKVAENDFLQKGDILLSHINSVEHLGKTAYFNLNEKIVHGVNLLRFRPDKSKVLPKYASEIFKVKEFIFEMQKYAIKAANQASLNSANLKALKIPLPPLDIQQKIVSEIEVLEAKEKKAKEEVEELKGSISDLMELNSNSKIEKLENLALILKRGKSAKYGDSEIQIIKSGQARGLKEFDFSQKHFVIKDFILDERKLEKGDILINSSGVGTAGRITLFNLEGVFVVDSHITILRPNKEIVLPDFVLQSLAKIGFKNIEAMAMGQSGQIELTIPTIQNIKIPLPPISEQQKIVSKIEKIEAKITALKIEIASIPKEKEVVLKKYL